MSINFILSHRVWFVCNPAVELEHLQFDLAGVSVLRSLIVKKSYRVKRDKDFQAIFSEGKSVANRQFVVYYLEKEQEHFRLGLSVSKRLGNAVVRNRIKRRLRHLVQEFAPQLKHWDFVVIARSGVAELTTAELKKNLRHVLNLSPLYEEKISE